MNNRFSKLFTTTATATLFALGSPIAGLAPVHAQTITLGNLLAMSVADAKALLDEALAKLEQAKNEGGDVDNAQAQVDSAKSELSAAQQNEVDIQTAADAEAQKAADSAAKQAGEQAAAEAQKAADEAAAQAKADEAATKQAEAEASKQAEADAKAADDAAAAKAEAAQAAADAKAAEDAAAAKSAADADAQKAAGDAAAAQAAADADAVKNATQPDAVLEKLPDPLPKNAAPIFDSAKETQAAGDKAPQQSAEELAKIEGEAATANAAAVAEAQKQIAAQKLANEAAAAQKAADENLAKLEADAKAATDDASKQAAQKAAAEAKIVADQEAANVASAQKMADLAAVATAAAAAEAAGKGAAPLTDAAALSAIVPIVVESARAEPAGQRITVLPAPVVQENIQIVKVINNSTIINVNNVYVVDTPEAPRLIQDDDEVIIEQLPRGKTRETIVRPNGVQVVTIRNRYGDIIQRSRILPDGREVYLSYSPEYDTEEVIVYRDPGLDLPPLQLRVPIREYILSVSLIDDSYDEGEVYYDFLDKPPVERVQRTYSVKEVKQSARVRDIARRIDLDTISFGFGSTDIEDDQIEKLQGVAEAMLKLLKKNPAETFLIEGHTDAVGTDIANLALSDKRAASIANALTNAFDVPSENLTTQGYGERYLKVQTQKPSKENRRVSIRRITSLIAPVALKN